MKFSTIAILFFMVLVQASFATDADSVSTAATPATITDTIFVPIHVTDTIYVASPPDTVFLQEEFVSKHDDPGDFENYINVDMDTIPPTVNFYIGSPIFLDVFSAWWGVVFLDFLVEKENTHRGSILFSWSSIMQLWNAEFDDDTGWWEGFRSSFSVGIGYRHYLTTITKFSNPHKKKIIHRNVPLNSTSFYVQGLATPTFKFAYENHLGDAEGKSADLSIGAAAEAAIGIVWNINNLLTNMGLSLGYQYWPDQSRKFLNFNNDFESEIVYSIISSCSSRAFYYKVILSFGF